MASWHCFQQCKHCRLINTCLKISSTPANESWGGQCWSYKWNSSHKMKTSQTDCTIYLVPLKTCHMLYVTLGWVSVLCCSVMLHMCLVVFLHGYPHGKQGQHVGNLFKDLEVSVWGNGHTLDISWQRSVVVWLPWCHRTEDDGLTCQTPLNVTSEPSRTSPAAGRYYSWISRKTQTFCPSSQKWLGERAKHRVKKFWPLITCCNQ